MSSAKHDQELSIERAQLAFLHAFADAEKSAATAERNRVLRHSAVTHDESRWEREVAVRTLSARVEGLRAAHHGLCFGRLDRTDGDIDYIGRVSLVDASDDYRPLLLDWRAPAARPFYCATAAHPDGVTRRRQFRTSGRTLIDFHDDHLTVDRAAHDTSDDTLLAALNAPRTDTMRDIVATIQSDQDEIIRLNHNGVLVIEGGPGTGKTAVALHRVAYLLYTNRDRLSRRGVLIVGPNPGFLGYISEVLPSLGETDVVFATPGELFPTIATTREDTPDARRVKGGLVMLDVLANAITARQQLPSHPIPIHLADGPAHLTPALVAKARTRARHSGHPHNQARPLFTEAILTALTTQATHRLTTTWHLTPTLGPAAPNIATPDPATPCAVTSEPPISPRLRTESSGVSVDVIADLHANIRAELSTHPTLHRILNALWPILTPQRLLADLFNSPVRIATAAPMLSPADRAALTRRNGAAWTVADVPLLDEAAELLGPTTTTPPDDPATDLDYATGVLQIIDTDEDPDGELLRAVDLIDAATLADRVTEPDHRPVAERAPADREWIYGHVVVDEAQELSEMDWRLLMRRCPSRSFTIVGDLAQRESPAGARDWSAMLDRYVHTRWQYRNLTVNYRMPVEIMAIAADVLALLDPTLPAPTSVRSTALHPWSHHVRPNELDSAVRDTVFAEFDRLGGGSVVVIAPPDTVHEVGTRVLTPRQAKGLEFDSVVLVEPQRILADPTSGPADLYVALTRATQWLAVLHTTPLPPALANLSTKDTVSR